MDRCQAAAGLPLAFNPAQQDQNGAATPAPDDPDSHELPFPVRGKDKATESPSKRLRGRQECYTIQSGCREAKTCIQNLALTLAHSSVR